MEIINKKMTDDFNIFCVGDTHLGSAAFSQRAFDCFVAEINSRYAGLPASKNYFIFKGDAIEGITIDDKRFDPTDAPKIFFLDEQVEEVVKLFKPIAKKCVAWHFGNHEWALRRFANVGERITKELNVPYGTFACRISYLDNKGGTMFKHFSIHGRKAINSTISTPKERREAMERMLKRHLFLLAGDCALMTKGHAHRVLAVEPEPEMYIDHDDWGYLRQIYSEIDTKDGSRHIHPDARWYGCSGSFLRTYILGASTYSERGEFGPVELGCIVVKVRDRKIAGMDRLIFDC